MKDFPKLSDAHLELSLTQSEIQFLMTIIGSFYESHTITAKADTKHTKKFLKALDVHSLMHYRFCLPYNLPDKPTSFDNHILDILENSFKASYVKQYPDTYAKSSSNVKVRLLQPQYKLLMPVLSYIYDSYDEKVKNGAIDSFHIVNGLYEYAMDFYGFPLPYGLYDSPKDFNKRFTNLLDEKIEHAYFVAQYELQDKFADEVNKLVKQIDPDIFNLQDGERINLAINEHIYTS